MAEARAAPEPILSIRDLSVSFRVGGRALDVITHQNLDIGPGEAVGLVGESGSGKTTLALATMAFLGPAGRSRGRILLEGRDLTTMSERELRAIRGRRVAMIYQDPMSSLNPLMTIGAQLMEVPIIHAGVGRGAAHGLAREILGEVDLPDPEWLMERYPHQLSGGQQQRVVIAMALISRPALLIMDEPTTALDVTVEAGVLNLVKALRRRHGMAILFISHNLRTVAQVCDRVAVMYAGEIVEEGPIRTVFDDPRHPYTVGLFDCLPTVGWRKDTAPLRPIPGQAPPPAERAPACRFSNRCEHVVPELCTREPIPMRAVDGATAHRAKCARLDDHPSRRRVVTDEAPEASEVAGAAARPDVTDAVLRLRGVDKRFSQERGLFARVSRTVTAMREVDLDVRRGGTLAIVGESGSGKSTLARVVCGLALADAGSIELDGAEIGGVGLDRRSPDMKRQLQMVFQNPDSTLNPSHSVGYALERTVRRLEDLPRAAARDRVGHMLEVVRLPADHGGRYPDQLSGGQKQRVAIARSLAGNPEIVIADEPVSALDVSVQAAIINLLNELQDQYATTLIFISHDLSVVRYLADSVAVMYLGRIVEYGPAESVFRPPFHPYTEALLSAVPGLTPDTGSQHIVLQDTPADSDVPHHGCPFSPRCTRKLGPICEDEPPPRRDFERSALPDLPPAASRSPGSLRGSSLPPSGNLPPLSRREIRLRPREFVVFPSFPRTRESSEHTASRELPYNRSVTIAV